MSRLYTRIIYSTQYNIHVHVHVAMSVDSVSIVYIG